MSPAAAPEPSKSARPTKGERTRARILDCAEVLFASRGFTGTSLREIAGEVGIREPGLYNYFAGKQDLYDAVLDRALRPMAEAMEEVLGDDPASAVQADLPGRMTDLLLEHPRMAALFQQALQGDPEAADALDEQPGGVGLDPV